MSALARKPQNPLNKENRVNENDVMLFLASHGAGNVVKLLDVSVLCRRECHLQPNYAASLNTVNRVLNFPEI